MASIYRHISRKVLKCFFYRMHTILAWDVQLDVVIAAKRTSYRWVENCNLHKFQKRGQPREVYSNFRKFYPDNFRSISLSCLNFRDFRLNRIFGNKTISVVSATFPRKFPYHLSPFRKFRIFGRIVSAHVYTDTEKFRPSLHSQCFNPRQPARNALNIPPNLFVRWESPLLEDLYLE